MRLPILHRFWPRGLKHQNPASGRPTGVGHSRNVLPLVVSLLPVFLVACGTSTAIPALPGNPVTDESPLNSAAAAPLTGQQRASIESLLMRGQRALQQRRLLTPIADSAFDDYEAVLMIERGNPLALKGLENIVESYLALALNAARVEQFTRADMLMRRAHIAFNGLRHWQTPNAATYSAANLERVAGSIRLLRGAERRRLLIGSAALRARDSHLAGRLAVFGEQAKNPGVRVVIRAPSDSAGRWIYQQLHNAPGEARIRAEIEIGIPAQVELLFIEKSSHSPPSPTQSQTRNSS